MNNSINYEDLFNWQLESDRHYMSLLQQKKEEEHEWEQMEEEIKKRLPAKIKIINNKRKINEFKINSRKILRSGKKKL